MDAVDIIRTKRDGQRLSDEQIRWFINSYTHGDGVADEQASALLMAIYFEGLDDDELTTWTRAMIDSGERLDLREIGRPLVQQLVVGQSAAVTGRQLCIRQVIPRAGFPKVRIDVQQRTVGCADPKNDFSHGQCPI